MARPTTVLFPRRGRAAGAVLMVSMALGAEASADPKLQGVGETWIGYTDNAQSAPDVPLPGGVSKTPGAFILMSPGVVLALPTRRSVQLLSYTYTYDLFLADTSLSTSSNRAGYRAFFDLSPGLGLVLGATAVQTNNSSSVVITPPGAGVVNALPSGSGSFLSATGDELLSYDISPEWRTYQAATVTEQTPLFETVAPRTFFVGGRAGIERAWEIDSAAIEPRLEYAVITGSLRPDGAPAGEQRQIVAAGVGVWRHDWGRSFTSRMEGGALRVERLNTDRGFWAPTAVASLAYVPAYGDADLVYAHTVTTNVLLGQSFLIDDVHLRGALPITHKGEVVAAASVGYQVGRILDENAQLADHIHAVLVDAGVGWLATKWLLLGIRYQHIGQVSDTRVPTLPVSFVRNSIMVGASVHYPPEDEMPRAYRSPRRVDRTDEIRDTVQPAVPRQRPGGATGT